MSPFQDYQTDGFVDEMFDPSGKPLEHCALLVKRLEALGVEEIRKRSRLADLMLLDLGITFNVYGDARGTEKPWPFDLVPRVIPSSDWDLIERGSFQRLKALNLFLDDCYHDQNALKDGIVPRDLVVNAAHFRREVIGVRPAGGVYVHVAGMDLIRGADRGLQVLEDNLRTPSGVSYMLENRAILTRVLPELFRGLSVRPVNAYPAKLAGFLRELAPAGREENPTVVLLTPGPYNSAYFEHSYLAQQLGVELVEGRDLFVDDAVVFMKTTRGPKRVDVVYRRLDDDFLDPLVFRPDSMLGVPGIVNAYRAGNVTLANALGTGVADDKVIYAYVPKLIEYYLSEKPILANVETYLAWKPDDQKYMLENLDKLVVKSANESGGYGMLIGPQATTAQRADFAEKIKAHPRAYIAQPLIALSRSPTFTGEAFEGRHLDLRPFVLQGKSGMALVPGGLTRVALRKGSYVVNSSQGGGSKDTWVLAPETGFPGDPRDFGSHRSPQQIPRPVYEDRNAQS